MQLIKALAGASPLSLSSESHSTLTLLTDVEVLMSTEADIDIAGWRFESAELNNLISLSALSEEITKSILMICILERHFLRNPLHPLVKFFKFLFVNLSPEVHIRLFGVGRYLVEVVDRFLVDVIDRYLVDVVDRHSQRKSKVMSEMDFERHPSGVYQDLVNVLGMVLAVVDRCSSVVIDRCSHFALDRCCPF
ncbi:hypothetical protein DY000_02009295 [Brassica cretica]|uniref:Gamma-tubulin complex component n=1 Tax=Brassica cretica TaxID=69181 RepID=A0ABQ7CHH9_BRACR|nr:hypothetical protein DY000_02009295 [Brassica cretica]